MFRNSFTFFVLGYIHVILSYLGSKTLSRVAAFVVEQTAWLHPLSRETLPRTFDNLAPLLGRKGAKGGGSPLIVWSHGLTGTGCEHGLLAVTLALRGNVVALVQHTDGSSSMADIQAPASSATSASTSTTTLSYIHPTYEPYDTGFRQRQVEHRAAEVDEARRLVLALPEFESIVNPAKAVVGGFSFGAATAGLAAQTHTAAATSTATTTFTTSFKQKKKQQQLASPWAAAVLIDGWWHIELKKWGVSQDLPLQIHKGPGLSIPSLFVGSAEFASYEALNNATKKVQAKCVAPCEAHVLPDTKHGNFMDALWWLPWAVTRNIGFTGTAQPHVVYAHWVGLVADFVEKHTSDEAAR
jgi:dienelactone hydrolase